jgi:hypothetical protein
MPTIFTCGSPGKRTKFTYEGDVHTGIVLKFASGDKAISAELLMAAVNVFRGKEIRGGFSMDNPPSDGFGAWVQNRSKTLNKTSLTPRHGSFIAAILQEVGLLRCSLDGNAVILKFGA